MKLKTMNLWSLGTRRVEAARCAHCGLPAPSSCVRDGSEQGPVFCCRACRQVYALTLELQAASTSEERPLVHTD